MQDQVLDITAALVRTAGLISDIRAGAAAEQELSAQQATVLCILAERTLPMAHVGALMRINKSSATWLIDRAEEAGLVHRTTDPHDRRCQIVELTEHGSGLGEKYRARVTELVEELITDLDPQERDLLRTTLSRVVLANQAQLSNQSPITWPSTTSAA
ncbi:MAG: winged helix DNA-binding protein [Cellulomonadaceae bacterium]|nr:winged helix DNA-binding protein [Cellulomonadaceae bacterium]